jgi:hypothetical protein
MADDASSAHDEMEKEQEELDKEMKELEENPPDKLEDWPGGKAKYRTMGGSEGESGYDEGPTSKLGPSEVRHHEDGKVTVSGEEVDNPEDFKGEPIPGGPTDPDAPPDPGMVSNKAREDSGDDDDEDEREDEDRD